MCSLPGTPRRVGVRCRDAACEKIPQEPTMSAISRREFFKNAATNAAVTGLLPSRRGSFAPIRWACPSDVRRSPSGKGSPRTFPARSSSSPTPDFRPSSCARPWVTPIPVSAASPNTKGPSFGKCSGDLGVTCVSSHFDIKELRRESGGPNCLGKRRRPDADAGAQPRRAAESDHGRREAGGRRIQQNGRAGGQGRHPAGPSQRGL